VRFVNACQNVGYPLPLKIRGQNPPFWTILRLSGNFSVLYLRNETKIEQVRCSLQRVSYIVSKRHELCSTNVLKLNRSFYPPSDNNATFFVAGLRTGTSDHRTQPNFVTPKLVNYGNKMPLKCLEPPPRKNLGALKLRTYFR